MFAKILSRYWWMTLVRGLLWIVFGVVLFVEPGLSLVTLATIFGLFVLVDGVVAAIRLRQEIEGEFWLILSGLASVAFGVLAIARPGAGALSVLWLIGAFAIVYSVLQIGLAVRARGFAMKIAGALKSRA